MENLSSRQSLMWGRNLERRNIQHPLTAKNLKSHFRTWLLLDCGKQPKVDKWSHLDHEMHNSCGEGINEIGRHEPPTRSWSARPWIKPLFHKENSRHGARDNLKRHNLTTRLGKRSWEARETILRTSRQYKISKEVVLFA